MLNLCSYGARVSFCVSAKRILWAKRPRALVGKSLARVRAARPIASAARARTATVMAFDFAKKPSANRVELKRITSWVEDALPESMAEVMVMVNELQCYEPVQPRARSVDAFS